MSQPLCWIFWKFNHHLRVIPKDFHNHVGWPITSHHQGEVFTGHPSWGGWVQWFLAGNQSSISLSSVWKIRHFACSMTFFWWVTVSIHPCCWSTSYLCRLRLPFFASSLMEFWVLPESQPVAWLWTLRVHPNRRTRRRRRATGAGSGLRPAAGPLPVTTISQVSYHSKRS